MFCIALLGSGISRIGNDLTLQDYLEQILNSLKLSNLDNAYNTRINIILHESVKEEINLFEIKSNDSSWRYVRTKVKPCKNCILVDLCPPISNYEITLKRFDLCDFQSQINNTN